MKATEDDLWDAIYSEIPPFVQPGEKTLIMIRKENKLTHEATEKLIADWLARGIIEPVGDRRNVSTGKAVPAWRPVAKPDKK